MTSASIRDFWQWFQEREHTLFKTDENSDELFDEVSEKLSAVHEDLGFEMTLVPDDDGRREFVVSAGGLLTAFDSVSRIVNAAPELERWRVVPFKPRKDVEGYLRMDGRQVALDSIYVSMRTFGAYVAITVYFPDFTEDAEQVFGEAAFVVLDLVLGEADVLRAVGPVEVCGLEEADMRHLIPLKDFAVEFDILSTQLAERLKEEFLTQRALDDSVAREEKHAGTMALHSSTVELLDDVVGEEFESFGLRVRFFSYSSFEADTLRDSLRARFPEAEVTLMQGPSLRGDGWISIIDVNYNADEFENGAQFLELLVKLGLDCHSELDLIQYTDLQLSSFVRTLPKINACLHYHYGEIGKAWQILDEAETEHIDDIDYWSLLAYLSAKTGKIERFSDAYQRLEFLLDEEGEVNDELVGPLWQLACACALVGESGQTCDLVEQILTVADDETTQEIRQELNESEDLRLIRGSQEFRDLQSRIGGYH